MLPHAGIVFHNTFVIATLASHSSVAVASACHVAKSTTIALHSSTCATGTVNIGAVASVMITLAVVVLVLPQLSLTVNVYTVDVASPQVDNPALATGANHTNDSSLHTSLATAFPSAANQLAIRVSLFGSAHSSNKSLYSDSILGTFVSLIVIVLVNTV